MSEKIKKLAKKIDGLLPSTETLQELYIYMTNLMRNQRDYFSYLATQDVIKLLFYIWSLKKSNDFIVGEKLLNKISFATLFLTTNEIYKDECRRCRGSGDEDCEYCDATSKVECESCRGDGVVECDKCEDGKIQTGDNEFEDCGECNGDGEVTCSDCAGDGRVSCDYCENGYNNCSKCDGTGEMETNDRMYTECFIVTWNKQIQDRCEITEGTADVTMSEYEFDKLRSDYVVLNYNDDLHENLEDFIVENEMYCSLYSDDPKMYFTDTMFLFTDEENMDVYKKN